MKSTRFIVVVFLCIKLLGCTPITGCIIPLGEGCNSKISFEPNELPIATVGKYYYVEINIRGGAVTPNIIVLVEPENNLTVEPIGKKNNYNLIKIYGEPTKAVNTTIVIMGETFGTMVSGKEFKKSYIIKVKEAE